MSFTCRGPAELEFVYWQGYVPSPAPRGSSFVAQVLLVDYDYDRPSGGIVVDHFWYFPPLEQNQHLEGSVSCVVTHSTQRIAGGSWHCCDVGLRLSAGAPRACTSTCTCAPPTGGCPARSAGCDTSFGCPGGAPVPQKFRSNGREAAGQRPTEAVVIAKEFYRAAGVAGPCPISTLLAMFRASGHGKSYNPAGINPV